MINIRGKRASASQYDKREFDKDHLEAAINLLSYGCEVLKYNKSDKKPIRRIYYIYEDDLDYLQYLHPNKPYEECRICLLDIIELKEIPTCELFKNLHPSKVLQITFSTKKHVLQFEMAEERDLFWQGLQYFLEKAEQQLNYGFTKLERTLFLENDLNQNRQLDIQEIKQLLEDLQIFINPKELIQIFNRFDKNKSGQIDYIEYKQLIKTILNQDQFKGLYLKYCTNIGDDIENNFDDNHGYMTKSDFINFLQQEQRSSNDQAFKNFASLNKERQYLMSFNQFFAYLLSIPNQLFDITKQQLYQSTDHPLTDYWINSSHNTYLMNNQLTGESSTQAYINALQKGCRCVELDCWDGPNNTPIIFHGYTMTSKITFESVIQVINEYAFKYSPFPLILSLEVHCSVKQQDAMADIINHYLGEYVLLLPDDYTVTEYYPTLEQLKRKIIIKHRGNMRSSLMHRGRFQSQAVANPNECYDSNHQQFDSENNAKKRTLNRQNHGLIPPKAKDDPDAEHEADEETVPRKKFHTSNIQPTLRPKYKLKYMGTSFNQFEPNPRIQIEVAPIIKHDSDDDISPDIPKKKVEESLKMSSLTALFGTQISQKNRTVWEIVSIEEHKVDTKFIDFHRRYFTRIYPAGSRVDSSNYDPVNAYNSGSQIVALNFQTNDMPMLINTCKFMENGGIESGYVLKPLWMRSEGKKTLVDFKQIQLKLSITILVAYNLRPQDKRKHIVDPQIKITLRGIPQDEIANPQKKSQTIKNNGFNPQFNYKFDIELRCPDLAFLVFEVSDNGKEFLGWNAIPVSAITYGYRALYLLNQNLKQIPNSCLVIHL